MEDLTGRFPCSLVPSSMSAGNTVSDDPALAMTAPGSPSVLPVPESTDRLPQPSPVAKPRTTVVGGGGSSGPGSVWEGFSDSGRWTQV